jgi:hypothetical protein
MTSNGFTLRLGNRITGRKGFFATGIEQRDRGVCDDGTVLG